MFTPTYSVQFKSTRNTPGKLSVVGSRVVLFDEAPQGPTANTLCRGDTPLVRCPCVDSQWILSSQVSPPAILFPRDTHLDKGVGTSQRPGHILLYIGSFDSKGRSLGSETWGRSLGQETWSEDLGQGAEAGGLGQELRTGGQR